MLKRKTIFRLRAGMLLFALMLCLLPRPGRTDVALVVDQVPSAAKEAAEEETSDEADEELPEDEPPADNPTVSVLDILTGEKASPSQDFDPQQIRMLYAPSARHDLYASEENDVEDIALPMHETEKHDLAETLRQLPLISQTDQRFQTKEYIYLDSYFGNKGCGPSSIANALICAVGLEEQSAVDQLLWEVSKLFSYTNNPRKSPVKVQYLSRMLTASEKEYPVLRRICDAWGERLYFFSERLTADLVEETLSDAMISRERAILFGFVKPLDDWAEIMSIAQRLYDRGEGNAIMTFGYLSAGTAGTAGPFKTEVGHYLSAAALVSDFVEKGEILLLDSFPRGLPGEKKIYRNSYSLWIGGNRRLTDVYDLERITRSVIRMTPNGKSVQELFSLGTWEERQAYCVSLLRLLRFYDTGTMIITLPGND
ncbi:MAG: hypothetical protein IJ083_16115 [Clostridia bacterium]|nr:hypothetical protein [Clostridia bacterium]